MRLFASETCAFDLVGANLLRDVDPGEMVVLTREGMTTRRVFADQARAQCMFEQVLLLAAGQRGLRGGGQRGPPLSGAPPARRHPAAADLVIAIPDSSNSAAQGYAEEAGLPFELGLIRNHYVGRTFIQAGQDHRVDTVRVKFNPVGRILKGKGWWRWTTRSCADHQPQAGGPDLPGGGHRSPFPRGFAAHHAPLPLRHRHADAGGADRQPQRRRRHPPLHRGNLARLSRPRRSRESVQSPAASATPAGPAATPRRCRENGTSVPFDHD